MAEGLTGTRYIESELRERLVSFIETEYLGKTEGLADACDESLRKRGSLFQEPYYEATPAYETMRGGIADAHIPSDAKTFLNLMSEAGRGVYQDPYCHQIESLESYWQGRDVLVSTGTGSGKTECFMWPMVSKLAHEAASSPRSWEGRAVRAVVLYPMNALVADQIARLRKMIGCSDGEFAPIWRKACGSVRRPQFGMYTGRTGYPGEGRTKQRDAALAKSLNHTYLEISSEAVRTLKEHGKYPEKENLKSYIEQLPLKGIDPWDPGDAELISRFEMQQHVPDILITNYSMLQLMLIRPVERGIWSSTARWLKENPDQKLLLVIDEAHMYKGAPGGEVALLIRRLIDKLDITSDRVSFILTSASIPEDREPVRRFFSDLTGKSSDGMTIITGKTLEIDDAGCIEPSASEVASIGLPQESDNVDPAGHAMRGIANLMDEPLAPELSGEQQRKRLGSELRKLGCYRRLEHALRGKQAHTLTELARLCFRSADSRASAAVDVLLNVSAYAEDESGRALLPIRMHMFMRGIQSITVCADQACDCHNSKHLDGLGAVQVNKAAGRCTCGALRYRMAADRNCGALFLLGYVRNTDGDFYFWARRPEETYGLIPATLMIIKDDSDAANCPRTGWLNALTGKVSGDDSYANQKHYVHVGFTDKPVEGLVSPGFEGQGYYFSQCPRCSGTPWISDFATRGNEAFYNVIARDFELQPGSRDEALLAKNPNAGKKVLLFSDSRQQAAKLALDLSVTSERDLFRLLIVQAAHDMQETEGNKGDLRKLYFWFLRVIWTNGIRIFEKDDRKTLVEHIREAREQWDEDGEFEYDSINRPPAAYQADLLRLLCSRYMSLSDMAVGYLSIRGKIWRRIENSFFPDGQIGRKDFEAILYAWSSHALVSNLALDAGMSRYVRYSVASSFYSPGVPKSNLFQGLKKGKGSLEGLLKSRYSQETFDAICEALKSLCEEDNGYLFLDPSKVTLRIEPDGSWYKCPRCGRIAPVNLGGTCPYCRQSDVRKLEDFKSVSFWRDPIVRILDGALPIPKSHIDTEEHTAQLSHSDSLGEAVPTTEDYEMRFQDIFASGSDEEPVDILSCTTTMEVGIDIGSLTAVGLRNVPPMRENYQQRAGRAGRRGSAISTILTYVDIRPYDNHYFEHPNEIVRGALRKPEIDVRNRKLLRRHITTVVFTRFGDAVGISIDKLKVDKFVDEYLDQFKDWLRDFEFSSAALERLIPEDVEFSVPRYKAELLDGLDKLVGDMKAHPDQYQTVSLGNKESVAYKALLDCLLEKAMLPTYSFPRDVIGFAVEDSRGNLIQEPQRSVDVAISEYAPGRQIVIDKTEYISGGVYSHISRVAGNRRDREAPAQKYFSSPDYLKEVLFCKLSVRPALT